MKIKNKLYILPLLLCLLSGCELDEKDENIDFLLETVFLDNDVRLLDYNAVKNTEREPFFIEEFNDNNSQFPYQIGEYSDIDVSIVDGKIIIEYLEKKNYMYSRAMPTEIDTNKNFEIELKLMVYRDSASQVLMWLRNSLSNINDYVFGYSRWLTVGGEEREFIDLYYRRTEDDWKSIRGYESNSKKFLDSDVFTTLTIRKIGGKHAIFINQKLFYIINDKNFRCIPTITMVDRVINVFDYFRVYYLS